MKKVNLLIALLFLGFVSNAQFTQVETFETTWIKPLFPVIAGIVFLVGVMVNLGKLKGEDRDIKKFVVSILIYPGVLMLVVGVYAMIKTIAKI